MKTSALTILTTMLACVAAFAHERITIGPKGGRVVALDSPATPNAEFRVDGGNFVVTLLDKSRQPLTAEGHTLSAIAGERSNPQKLSVEKKDGVFVVGPKPAGDDYWVIFQLRETAAAKPLTFRIHYQTQACGECHKPEWLCVCGAKTSGENVSVPASLDGLWAEINGHHGELKDNFNDKKYEALDEVTQAFPVLLKALPGKSGDKQAAVRSQVESIVKDVAAIAQANAARKLADAKSNLEAVNRGIEALKKSYPEKTANAKL